MPRSARLRTPTVHGSADVLLPRQLKPRVPPIPSLVALKTSGWDAVGVTSSAPGSSDAEVVAWAKRDDRCLGDGLWFVHARAQTAVPGHSPSQRVKWRTDGNCDISAPVSEMTASAVVTSMPSMRVRPTPRILNSWVRRSATRTRGSSTRRWIPWRRYPRRTS